MMLAQLQEVIEFLENIAEDEDCSKKFKEVAEKTISILQSGEQLAIDKALLQLEELNSSDMSSYHRTQVWDIVSMLESIK